MRVSGGRLGWGVAALAVVLAVAAVLAPELDASAAREPLARALREATGREVELGEVRYRLFPVPGLSAADLVIPEDPRFGLEPIAYISELHAGLHWPSLAMGKLRLGSVRLIDASINLARAQEAGWNIAQLLRNLLNQPGDGPAPKVEVRGGRINFRESTVKSPFYLNQVDIDLERPSGADGRLSWSYEASPARSDRAESGFGRFSGRGAWVPSGATDGRLEIDIELERSLTGEVMTLVTGRDLGLQGRLSTRAHMDGPVENVRIAGSLQIENSGPQPLFGFTGEDWAVSYEGRLNLASQEFTVYTTGARQGDRAPLGLKASCQRLLSQPQWTFSFQFDNLQAPALIELAKRFGARGPQGLILEGLVDGALDYVQEMPLSGRVTLREASVSLGGAGPLKIPEAAVTVKGPEIILEPAEMSTPGEGRLELSGRWDLEKEATEFRLKTAGLPASSLRAAIGQLPNVPEVPALSACSSGELAGELRYERRPSNPDAPAAWTGEVTLKKAACAVAGAPSLLVEQAVLTISGTKWTARNGSAVWGPWTVSGQIEHLPAAARPYRATLSIPEVSGDDMEEFLRPALRRRLGFLERTFRGRPSSPRWLASRRAEGLVKIGRLTMAGLEASDLRLAYYWDGSVIDIPDVSAAAGRGRFSGRWRIDLDGEAARSRLQGRLDGFDAGPASLEAEFEASWPGFGISALDRMSLTGHVAARALEFPELPIRAIQACVEVDPRRGRDRLHISCLEAFSAVETFSGSAARQDSKWVLDFTGPRRQFRLVGGFSPMEWELEPRPREAPR